MRENPMQCPKCQNTMREREKGDVIDHVCPACKGIWLRCRRDGMQGVRYENRYYRRDDDDDDDDRAYGDRYGEQSRVTTTTTMALHSDRPRDRHVDRGTPLPPAFSTSRALARKTALRGGAKSFLGGLMENFGGGDTQDVGGCSGGSPWTMRPIA